MSQTPPPFGAPDQSPYTPQPDQPPYAPPADSSPYASEQGYGAPQPGYGEGQAPYPPTQGAYAPGQQPYAGGPQQPGRPGSGLAIAAFVIGIVALLLAWIPVVNIVAIIGGVVAIVLGAIALSKVKKGLAGGKGFAIAGLVLSGIAIIASILMNVILGAAISAVDDAVQESIQDTENQLNDEGSEVSTEEQQAATDDVLPLGQTAELGEYTVTVTGVNLNANEAMAGENMFNEPATNQYVLVDVSVVYNGAEEGDPWLDLTHAFQGTDARQYDSSSCNAVEPNSIMDVPTLTQGGAADYQVCMDVPAEAMEGASIFVEESFSFTDSRAYWSVQ